MYARVLTSILLSFAIGQAFADGPSAPPKNASELSKALTGLSDACTTKATEFASADQVAIFQQSEDRKTAQLQIEMDTRVYGVGHGRSETSQHMIDLMQAQSQQESQAATDFGVKASDEDKQVSACTDSAEESGKALYSAFKSSRKKKDKMDEANAVMTAWLVEIKSITKGTPKGSAEASAAWQSSKAHAELEAL
jgi:hypothetical protein